MAGFTRNFLEKILIAFPLVLETHCFSWRATCSAPPPSPARSFQNSPGIIWWGADTLCTAYTFISDVDFTVLCWEAFCFHRTSSKNTHEIRLSGRLHETQMIHLVFNSKSTTKQNRASVAADLRSAAYSAVFHIVVFKNIFLGKGRYSPPLEVRANTWPTLYQYLRFQGRWALSRWRWGSGMSVLLQRSLGCWMLWNKGEIQDKGVGTLVSQCTRTNTFAKCVFSRVYTFVQLIFSFWPREHESLAWISQILGSSFASAARTLASWPIKVCGRGEVINLPHCVLALEGQLARGSKQVTDEVLTLPSLLLCYLSHNPGHFTGSGGNV